VEKRGPEKYWGGKGVVEKETIHGVGPSEVPGGGVENQKLKVPELQSWTNGGENQNKKDERKAKSWGVVGGIGDEVA